MKIYRARLLMAGVGIAGLTFVAVATIACSDEPAPSPSAPLDGSLGETTDAGNKSAAADAASDSGPQDASVSDATPGTTCLGGPFAPQTPSATCSLDSEQPLDLTFINNSARAVSIYWVNYSCVEVIESTLQPCETFSINSYVGHPWRIRDLTTATLYKEFIPTSTAVSTVTVH